MIADLRTTAAVKASEAVVQGALLPKLLRYEHALKPGVDLDDLVLGLIVCHGLVRRG